MTSGVRQPIPPSEGSKTASRAIEMGFPIVEINRLAEPERNSFKPIYQIHKWFARRASCVFRAILLGALKPAFKEDGTPTDLMEEFYRDHGQDPDTQGKVVLDPFMGGGTTVVEALRLAICTDPNCRKEVPLFKDYLVAAKTLSVKYHRDVLCPACKKAFDWDVDVASLIADAAFMVSSPRGAAGEGRPTAAWSYAPEPPRPKGKRETTPVTLSCPHCAKHVRVNVPWDRKKHRKKVPLTVLLCSACEAVWQWRGPLAEGEVTCPGCRHSYDPRKGNVPQKGYFQCRCGNKDRIIESIRLSPKDRRLPVRPYALQAYLVDQPEERIESGWQQAVLFEDMPIQQPLPFTRRGIPEALLLPRNGKFFKRWSASDQARLQRAEMLWAQHKTSLPYPKSAIPRGAETARLLEHHYNHWHEMFGARQLLTLSTLLAGIMAEQEEKLRELLLCAFSGVLESNNVFTRQRVSRKSAGGQTAEGVFGRHDFQPKNTLAENNTFGLSGIAGGTWLSQLVLCRAGIEYRSLAGISFLTTRVKAAVNWSLIC